jgi:hypothetical protein
MDRVRLHDHLAQAERHIAKGQKIIAQQRATIAQLKSSGCNVRSMVADEAERTCQTHHEKGADHPNRTLNGRFCWMRGLN